jgi:thiamine-phosphate pyrophosphorylase
MGILQFSNRLYAITDRELSFLPHDQIVAQLLVAGVRTIQLRDKTASTKELLDAARSCLKLTRAAGAILIINDSIDVALASGADGVHLGQEDTAVDEARRALGSERLIGLSTHSIEQFCGGLTTTADYLAVGPVFSTSTKENPSPVVGLDLVRAAHELSDRPVVAIGGIDVKRAKRVIDAGADAIAVVSALYPPPDLNSPLDPSEISQRASRLLAICRA